MWDKASHVNRVAGKLRVAVKVACGFGVVWIRSGADGGGESNMWIRGADGGGMWIRGADGGGESNMWIRGADGAQ